ncbi:transglutaminaseTgpA domain-containing protein [Alteromonas sp. H39]|uniref:transglutaminase family protein n=1 Tax=Alteromonas sp. H39 TaxID=3389876 RepID=UPI0039E0233C
MTALRLPIAGHRASLILAILFFIVSVSLYSPLQIWVLILSGCAALVRVALYLGWYNHAPSSRTVNLLALLCGVTLAWFSLDLGLLLSMINLLVMACSLKLMLMSRKKDFLQMFASSLFLIGCGFIFSQSMSATAFYLAMQVGLLVALASLFSPGMPLLRQLRKLAVMSLQALPIAVILFLILPQLPPLWKMPTAKSATTGLSDTVTPGDIASLSQSDELAFNATFENALPAAQDRYWRAITMEHFDGKSWSVSDTRRKIRAQYKLFGQEFTPETTGPFYDYQVIAEATGKSWLYGIDVAVAHTQASRDYIWQSADYQLIASQPLMSKRAYRLRSFPRTPLNQTLLNMDSRLNLQLPDSGNPATREWVAELRKQYADDRVFIRQVMNFFVEQKFRYTLNPDPMPVNPVDTFLFDRQAGFCTHYASAMAYVLRLAGIPARLVTGYHGGEELKDNVLSVRQYDAHAWIEAMLGEQGWVRFDPTSIVSPARVSFGLQQALEESGESLSESPFSGLYSLPMMDSLRLFMANADYLWSRWVLGFDAESRENLLERILGEITLWRLTLFFLSVVAGIAAILGVYFLPRWRANDIPAHRKLINRAEKVLFRHTGIARNQRALREYEDAVSLHLSDEAALALHRLIGGFETLEYAPQQRPQSILIDMKTALKTLRASLSTNGTDAKPSTPPG